MRVRDWDDIVADVVESGAEPEGWRAVAGDRANGLGEDLYLGHPNSGVYHLKTYAKNPFEVHGVGTRVARRLDDELEPLFPGRTDGSRFAVQSPPEDEDEAADAAKRLEAVVEAHADAPTTPGDFFDDVMDALDSPAFGPMEFDNYDRPEGLDDLATTFEDAEDVLNTELDEVIEADGVDRGFM
ncbi:hypothetical protein [Haloarchaeobius litoreus]|uniref:Uncharacterized protein n=1 Tax=Haloarchaeobius litoreus TaxID=755306 RepID=A0ABD6DLN6_9EURY|nr:hypothetical protein [Haloarchaeobius litoreus]